MGRRIARSRDLPVVGHDPACPDRRDRGNCGPDGNGRDVDRYSASHRKRLRLNRLVTDLGAGRAESARRVDLLWSARQPLGRALWWTQAGLRVVGFYGHLDADRWRGFANHRTHNPPLLFDLDTDTSERWNTAKNKPDLVSDIRRVVERHQDAIPGDYQPRSRLRPGPRKNQQK